MDSLFEFCSDEEFYFQWHITQRCNLRCRHCYHSDYSLANELPVQQLFHICDILDHALGIWHRKGSLSLTGGEPLVRESDLFTLIGYIEQKRNIYYYDLLTNGTLLTPSNVEYLCTSKKLRRVQLSLEGPGTEINDYIRGSGVFDQVIKAIKLLKSYNMQVSVMTTIGRYNISLLDEMFSCLASLNVDAFAVERFIPEGKGTALAPELLSREELYEAFKLIYQRALQGGKPRILLYRPLFASFDAGNPTVGAVCSIGNNALTIMHDGTVYPCRRLPIPIGNIIEDGLFKIWYDSSLLWEIRDPRNLKGKCSGCKYLALCRGCRALAYHVNKDYLAEDPQCWL